MNLILYVSSFSPSSSMKPSIAIEKLLRVYDIIKFNILKLITNSAMLDHIWHGTYMSHVWDIYSRIQVVLMCQIGSKCLTSHKVQRTRTYLKMYASMFSHLTLSAIQQSRSRRHLDKSWVFTLLKEMNKLETFENIVAFLQVHFLPLPQCFQMSSAAADVKTSIYGVKG